MALGDYVNVCSNTSSVALFGQLHDHKTKSMD